MGEYADMILDGDMCQTCGEFIGPGGGYARFCYGCRNEFQRIHGQGKKVRFKKCAHPKCDGMIPGRKHACQTHWLQLPIEIRKQIVDGQQIKGPPRDEILGAGQRAARSFWRDHVKANMGKQIPGAENTRAPGPIEPVPGPCTMR